MSIVEFIITVFVWVDDSLKALFGAAPLEAPWASACTQRERGPHHGPCGGFVLRHR